MDEHKQRQEEYLNEPDTFIPEEEMEVTLPTARIAYVMAIVAVLCGGNGIGIVAAGLFWKKTANLTGAIGIVVCCTAAALLVVAAIVLIHKRHVKKKLEQNEGE